MSELTISDDWHPSGLAGTGSNTVITDGVFVPAHRTLPMDGALRGESAQVVRLARQAIETLNSLSGASSIQRGVPMQRIFRDIQALALHAALDINTNLEVYGRLIAGLDPNTPFL